MSDQNEQSRESATVAAIEFALQPDSDGLEFLRVWFHGDFDSIRKEWPEAPEAVFIGADPLHPKTTEPEEKRFWPELESFVEDYIGGYEFRGDEGDYTPNDRERFLIEDCAAGLLHEMNQEGWLPQSPSTPQPSPGSPEDASGECSQSDLNAENARLRAELETLKRHQSHAVSTAIREAIEETRVAFSEGGEKWLCRVTDLEEYADRLAGQPVGAPVPGGWDLERDSENCITVHHPDIGCYAARTDENASVASIILYHLAEDLMEGK